MTDKTKKISTPMMDALLFLYNNLSRCAYGIERPAPARQTINALFNRGLLELNSDSIIIPNALGLEVLALRFPQIEEGVIPDKGWDKIAPELFAEIAAGARVDKEHKTNSALPLSMYIRFLEVIQLDLDALLNHINDSAFFKHNAPMAQGFILNLRLSYSDQNCDGFLQMLSDLQNEFPCLYKNDSDKVALLTRMTTRVSNLLDFLRDSTEVSDA